MGKLLDGNLHFWSTDATTNGTKKVFQTETKIDSCNKSKHLRSIVYNNQLYFICGRDYIENLYLTNGTNTSTPKVFNYTPYSAPYEFKVFKNNLVHGKHTSNRTVSQQNNNSALYMVLVMK